jgi:hypothetical protein
VVVLDPNSDYVRLAEPGADADRELAQRYAAIAGSISIRSGVEGPGRVGVRFRELGPAQQAALLRLDPLADRDEYAELMAVLEDERIRGLDDLDGGPLRRRARNLGVDRWGIWPGADGPSLVAELEDPDGPCCVVVDLGSLGSREEQAVVAGAVLERLWRGRAKRNPIAIVIDEAHNVCPAEPEDAITALATADAIRIAGEGRKFGIYLIVVTQRPQKVHENVVSQCENLVLMRMNSTADLAHVGQVFSFVPRGLIDRAATFRQGEALVAGKVASHPALIRFGARLTQEGGADVSGWASSSVDSPGWSTRTSTPGASSAAWAAKRRPGSVNHGPRDWASEWNVPQWIGTATRARSSAAACAARRSSRCPGPSLGL